MSIFGVDSKVLFNSVGVFWNVRVIELRNDFNRMNSGIRVRINILRIVFLEIFRLVVGYG